jgi:hypothetical protein
MNVRVRYSCVQSRLQNLLTFELQVGRVAEGIRFAAGFQGEDRQTGPRKFRVRATRILLAEARFSKLQQRIGPRVA